MKKISFWTIFLCFVFVPIGLLILQSFTAPGSLTEPSMNGWTGLFERRRLVEATLTSLVIGAFVVLFNIVIGMSAGKALALYRFQGKDILDTLLLMPILLPLLAITFGVHIAMIRIGLADTAAGVILIHLVPTVPYSIKIFRNGYVSLGGKILEQAEMLGASAGRTFLDIELPLLRAPIQSVVFLTFVISLSQYVITAIIGGGTVVTLAMVYFPFLESANTTLVAAFSLWFALLPLSFYLFAEGLIRLLPYQRRRRRRTHDLFY
ncbi:ABC transporter permease [Salimicrobium halophilum]|uniref:Putative spermidine/putrescine transport system permease protein n=1 Tax=Salimicrobium halophilum TaxID=86666 RepID=A0A1G8R302_9BACI|nr:ABC transporter permease subunit [Salimicrobium halophilum]SDJ11362.1 putative spermidine/putrescine transport system permease protein [Salimicrobium halophilum]